MHLILIFRYIVQKLISVTLDTYYTRRKSCSIFLSFQLIAINEGINMRVILLSLMIVCLFGYRAKGCANCGDPVTRRCEGFAEIRSEFNGTETVHGKMIVDESNDLPVKASKMRYSPRITGGRRAQVTIEVQGDCCWKFYQR